MWRVGAAVQVTYCEIVSTPADGLMIMFHGESQQLLVTLSSSVLSVFFSLWYLSNVFSCQNSRAGNVFHQSYQSKQTTLGTKMSYKKKFVLNFEIPKVYQFLAHFYFAKIKLGCPSIRKLRICKKSIQPIVLFA